MAGNLDVGRQSYGLMVDAEKAPNVYDRMRYGNLTRSFTPSWVQFNRNRFQPMSSKYSSYNECTISKKINKFKVLGVSYCAPYIKASCLGSEIPPIRVNVLCVVGLGKKWDGVVDLSFCYKIELRLENCVAR